MKKLASILAVTLAAGVLATGCGSSSGSASKDSSSDSGKTVIKEATGANAKPYSINEYTTIKDLVTGAELIAGLITDEQ